MDDPVLKIKNGRHPLVERLVDAFIPNSTILVDEYYFTLSRLMNELTQLPAARVQIGGRGVGSESSEGGSSDRAKDETNDDRPKQPGGMRTDSIMIVTGANYSGKSVHLKAVALITFLAHIGKSYLC